MKFTKAQNRFINNRFIGTSILKGKSSTGKTTTAINRAINLENNNCLFRDDKVLYIVSNEKKKLDAIEKYNELVKTSNFYSLFSTIESKVCFKTISEIITDLHIESTEFNSTGILSINSLVVLGKLKDVNFFQNYKDLVKSTKVLKSMTEIDLVNEFIWIKASNLSHEDYLTIDRKGQSITIRKNSTTRNNLYNLYNKFIMELMEVNYYDTFDAINSILKSSLDKSKKYSHIIVDDSHELSRIELNLISSLINHTPYSTTTLIYSLEQSRDNKLSWLVKGRKFDSMAFNSTSQKNYILKNKFIDESAVDISCKKNNIFSLESYKYINLKYKNETVFNIDTALSSKEILLNNNISFSETELKPVPVFNEIAAGNPIEINEEFQENFYLPKAWLDRGKDTFILQVKGNSMIDKNICDGDLVVIKKQNTANHLDIIAASVDGEATLKTLSLSGKEPLLMPANNNYNPIKISNREVSVLGVAIGVIKNN